MGVGEEAVAANFKVTARCDLKTFLRVWMGGGGGGYKCQLSVKFSAICQLSVKFLAICQLSVNWLLIINYAS